MYQYEEYDVICRLEEEDENTPWDTRTDRGIFIR